MARVARVGHVLAVERDRALGGLAQPDDRLDELVLAVAGDAGDPEDLARPDLEVDAADGLAAAVVRDLAGPATFSADVARVATRRGRRRAGRSRPTISSARSSSSVSRRDPRADDPAAPDDRDPVGDLEDLVELVADEDDAVALLGEPAEDGEDLLGLLRRQHGGRLVEDEDPGVAIERLEDLDPLLPADGQLADLDVGVDLEAEPLAELDDPPLRLACGRGRPGWPSSPRRGGCSRRRSGRGPA